MKVHWFERVWIAREWYNIRYRDGGKETRKRRGEVFGCIPHGRGAFRDFGVEIQAAERRGVR